jgi:hypothetical protein
MVNLDVKCLNSSNATIQKESDVSLSFGLRRQYIMRNHFALWAYQ